MTDDLVTIFTSDAVAEIANLASVVQSSAEFDAVVDNLSASPGATIRAQLSLVGAAPPDLGQMQREGVDQALIAQALHVWLGPLTRVAGSDHRLWTYLSTITFRDYSKARWPLAEGHPSKRLLRRWIVTRANRESLARNGVARLWWAARLTHDPAFRYPLTKATANPYAYTAELFRSEDRFVGIVEREVGAIPNVLFPLLDHLSSSPETATEAAVRSMLRELTLAGGYADLASFTVDESRRRMDEIQKFAKVAPVSNP